MRAVTAPASTARVRVLVCAALVSAAATRFTARTVGEPEFDLWWMLVVGRLAGLRAAFPDPLSFTAAGAVYHNHTYLHCALLAALERLGGLDAVWLLKVALGGGLSLGVVRFLWTRVRDPLALLGLGMLGFGVFVVPWLQIRPQLWTYLAVFALLALMQRARDETGWRLLLAVPLVAVWQALHGAAALGVVLLAVEAGGSTVGWLERRPSLRRAGPRWCVLGAVLVVAWLGPYDLVATVTQKIGSLEAYPTTEWLPVWNQAAFAVAFPGAAGVVTTAAIAAAALGGAGVLVAARRIRGRGYHREAVLLLVALVLSLRMIRNLPLLGLALVVLLAEPLDAVAAGRAPSYGRTSVASLAAAVVALVGVTAVRCLDAVGADPAQYPVAACAWLARERPQGGTLMSDDPRGSFATWCLPRSWKVSLDGREELLYPPAVLVDHRALGGPAAAAGEVVARWAPDAVLLPASVALAQAPEALRGYAVRYRDARFVVWLKESRAG